MKGYTVKKNHIGSLVSEILWYTHTDPVTLIHGLLGYDNSILPL